MNRYAFMILGVLAVAACGGGAATTVAPSGSSGTTANPGTLKAPGDAKIGDRTTCPISKEEFTVTEASPKAEHAGKTYYFCCPGCDAKFKSNPGTYVKGSGT